MPRKRKWIEERYNKLWQAFKDRKFTREEAIAVLREFEDDEDTINVILSQLRKMGWLRSEPDPTDARKSVYQLKSFAEILKISSERLTRSDIEALLKKAADLIRTRVDYKFILILLFLKLSLIHI